MAQNPQTSFIPKKPISQGTSVKSSSGSGIGIFMLLAVLVFIISIISAGGVFLYKNYLSRNIENMSASLTRAEAAFEPTLIEELKRLDQRIEASKELLNKHVAPSNLFELLESVTPESIRFKKFSYSTTGDKNSLNMNGQARDYASVALQSDAFGNIKHVSNTIFSGLDLDSVGRVEFSLSTDVSQDFIKYNSTSGKVEIKNPDEEKTLDNLNATTTNEEGALE